MECSRGPSAASITPIWASRRPISGGPFTTSDSAPPPSGGGSLLQTGYEDFEDDLVYSEGRLPLEVIPSISEIATSTKGSLFGRGITETIFKF